MTAAAVPNRSVFRQTRVRSAFVAAFFGLTGAVTFRLAEAVAAYEPEPVIEWSAPDPYPTATFIGYEKLARSVGMLVTVDDPKYDALELHGSTTFCPTGGFVPLPDRREPPGRCSARGEGTVEARRTGSCMRLFACDGRVWRPL